MATKQKVLPLRRVRKQLGLTKKQLRAWIERGHVSPTVVAKSGYKGFTAGLLTGKQDADKSPSQGKEA